MACQQQQVLGNNALVLPNIIIPLIVPNNDKDNDVPTTPPAPAPADDEAINRAFPLHVAHLVPAVPAIPAVPNVPVIQVDIAANHAEWRRQVDRYRMITGAPPTPEDNMAPITCFTDAVNRLPIEHRAFPNYAFPNLHQNNNNNNGGVHPADG